MRIYIFNLAILLTLSFLIEEVFPDIVLSLPIYAVMTLALVAIPLIFYFREHKPSSLKEVIKHGAQILLPATFMFGVFVLGYTQLIDRIGADTNILQSSASPVGRNIKPASVSNVRTGLPLTNVESTTLYIVISPTCPYCKNALTFLQENRSLYDSISRKMNIIPVFREKTSVEDGNKMIAEIGFGLPVYRAVGSEVINSIQGVPAFVLVSNDQVRNISVGGFQTKQDLKWIINNLIQGSSQSTALY